MTLRLVPHAEEWREAVRALNERVAPKGGAGFFEGPVPSWLPPAPGRSMFRQYFVAVDDAGEAHGGYVLKREPALVAGRPRTVASVQGPYSEGAVDPRYAGAVFAMVRDMLEREPLLYGWGLERRADTVLRLFHKLGWRSHATPLLLLHAGSVAGPPAPECEEVAAFGDWADELWDRCAERYAFAVIRDRRTLNDLYPAANGRFRRLVVRRKGRVVGWALAGVRSFENHPRFGTSRAGVLWDFFAGPEDAAPLVAAARDHLLRLGAKVVLASASHAGWIEALQSAGFELRPERRHFLVSRPLAAALGPFEGRAAECFLTFGDGESYLGPLGEAMFGGA
jgi:hypothetical protein